MKIFINICENIQLICFRFTDVTDSTLFLQVDLSSYDKIIIFGVSEMVSLADISWSVALQIYLQVVQVSSHSYFSNFWTL